MPKCKIFCECCGEYSYGVSGASTCDACLDKGIKFCRACEQIKPLDAFPTTRGAKCKECKSMQLRTWRSNTQKGAESVIKGNKERYATDVRAEATRAASRKCMHVRRSTFGSFTQEQWQEALAYFDNKCAYCGSTGKLTVEHIVPVSTFGTSFIYNIVPACPHCNSSKRDTDILTWFPRQTFYSEEKLLKIHSWHMLNKHKFE